jgi:hypothetical protein
MTTRDRWDETRSLIEAGWHSGWGPVYPQSPEIDWDDIKRAEADADRMLYGGMFTPQRED